MDYSFNFDYKTALVLGGSSCIGRCLIENLRKYGCIVYYTCTTLPSNISLDELKYIYIYNATKPELLTHIYDTINKNGIILNFVINNLGIGSSNKIDDIEICDWNNIYNINLTSVFVSCKEAIKIMKKQNHGKIINVSSIAGRDKSQIAGVDCTSTKYAIIGLTKQLAQEVACNNIYINAVCPSYTRNSMINKLGREKIKNIEKNIPLGRIAEKEDIVKPILFLCSSLASYITGSCIDINGGQL